MMYNLIRSLRQQKGLTLIELIVVVAIIAVLAFTITPRVLDALSNSRYSGAKSAANELHAALERYYTDKGVVGAGTYPQIAAASDNMGTLAATLGDSTGVSNTTANIFGSFAYKAYTDNPGTATWTTGSTAAAKYYCIAAADKNAGTDQKFFRITPKGVEEGTTAFTCT